MRARGPDIYPPDHVLTEIGRIAVAAASLDATLAHLHEGFVRTHTFATVTTWPAARIRRELTTAAGTLPDPLQQQLLDWLDETRELADQRDRAVHAFAIISLEPEGTRRTSAFHPRTGTYQVHDADALADLARRIGTCNVNAYELLVAVTDQT